jgi:hypothetical protein
MIRFGPESRGPQTRSGGDDVMKAIIAITKSVGKNAVNVSKDVAVIQNRLNQWIAAGKLPRFRP